MEDQDDKLEECVSKLKDKHGEAGARAICKTQKKKESKSDIDLEVLGMYMSKQAQYVSKAMQTGRTHMQALSDFQAYLAKTNYEL